MPYSYSVPTGIAALIQSSYRYKMQISYDFQIDRIHCLIVKRSETPPFPQTKIFVLVQYPKFQRARGKGQNMFLVNTKLLVRGKFLLVGNEPVRFHKKFKYTFFPSDRCASLGIVPRLTARADSHEKRTVCCGNMEATFYLFLTCFNKYSTFFQVKVNELT